MNSCQMYYDTDNAEIKKAIVADFGELGPLLNLLQNSPVRTAELNEETFRSGIRFREENKHPTTGESFNPIDADSVLAFTKLGSFWLTPSCRSVSYTI